MAARCEGVALGQDHDPPMKSVEMGPLLLTSVWPTASHPGTADGVKGEGVAGGGMVP